MDVDNPRDLLFFPHICGLHFLFGAAWCSTELTGKHNKARLEKPVNLDQLTWTSLSKLRVRRCRLVKEAGTVVCLIWSSAPFIIQFYPS